MLTCVSIQIHTFKTKRTLRVHKSAISNALSHKEQLCGLEHLRLWSNDDVGNGSLLATIHYSASFSSGYLAFCLCGPHKTVNVKEDGEKWVKVKGLDVSLMPEGTDMMAMKRRQSSTDAPQSSKPKKEKIITGVWIEFEKASDQARFLQVCGVRPSAKAEKRKSEDHVLTSIFKPTE